MSCELCGALLDAETCATPSCALLIGASPPVKRTWEMQSDGGSSDDDSDATRSPSFASSYSTSSSSPSSSRAPTPPLFDEQDIVLEHFLHIDDPPMQAVHRLGPVNLTKLAQLIMWTVPATAGWLVGPEPSSLEDQMASRTLSEADHEVLYAQDHEALADISTEVRTRRLFELLSAYLHEYGVSVAPAHDRMILEQRIEPRLAARPQTGEVVALRRLIREVLLQSERG